MGRLRLLLADFVLSFMWVCSGVLVRLIVFQHLGFDHSPLGEVIKTTFSVANMFFFSFLVKVTRGAYNPSPFWLMLSLGILTTSSTALVLESPHSLSKLTLHILGSDLTGGCMNPASVMGWAYARGDHITKEHFFVYWLAPIEATILAVWTSKLLVQPAKEDNTASKSKSD
ncbi:hypothetical protein ACSQ67_000974 [Phaseolus vulgaris]